MRLFITLAILMLFLPACDRQEDASTEAPLAESEGRFAELNDHLTELVHQLAMQRELLASEWGETAVISERVDQHLSAIEQHIGQQQDQLNSLLVQVADLRDLLESESDSANNAALDKSDKQSSQSDLAQLHERLGPLTEEAASFIDHIDIEYEFTELDDPGDLPVIRVVNGLKIPLSSIDVRVHCFTPGRVVPWLDVKICVAPAGGIQPGESAVLDEAAFADLDATFLKLLLTKVPTRKEFPEGLLVVLPISAKDAGGSVVGTQAHRLHRNELEWYRNLAKDDDDLIELLSPDDDQFEKDRNAMALRVASGELKALNAKSAMIESFIDLDEIIADPSFFSITRVRGAIKNISAHPILVKEVDFMWPLQLGSGKAALSGRLYYSYDDYLRIPPGGTIQIFKSVSGDVEDYVKRNMRRAKELNAFADQVKVSSVTLASPSSFFNDKFLEISSADMSRINLLRRFLENSE